MNIPPTEIGQMPGFKITGAKGFHIAFENGWHVSVQFGPGNYCENRDAQIGQEEEACGRRGSLDAETAVWGPNGKMIDRGEGDTVQGWQTPAQVLELLTWAASQPTKAE
jgi:hypothetical protein